MEMRSNGDKSIKVKLSSGKMVYMSIELKEDKSNVDVRISPIPLTLTLEEYIEVLKLASDKVRELNIDTIACLYDEENGVLVKVKEDSEI
jgi:hypothetical protein